MNIIDEINKRIEICSHVDSAEARGAVGVLEELLSVIEKEEEKPREPISAKACIEQLANNGFRAWYDAKRYAVSFFFRGERYLFFPKSGYFSGKGIENGYGLKNMIEQIKSL